jgi:hypothetical protein
MILRYVHLSAHPTVFVSVTGLRVGEFDHLVQAVLPRYRAARLAAQSRPTRKHAIGAGAPFALSVCDQILLTVVWLRLYPIYEVLGYLFGVSDTTALRTVGRVLPLLEQAGLDTMRQPDPGRGHRRTLDTLLHDTPQLAVVIDTFEQRVQRPLDRTEADTYYSGKKKMHTLKSQVAVHETSGRLVDVPESVRGPTADLALLEQSQLLDRLPAGVGGLGDLGYVGIGRLHPQGLGACPRRKPRGQPRPPEDVAYNTAFSRRRIIVEHTIRRVRCYAAVSLPDRHHRQHHTARVRAIGGLVNRQIDERHLA